MKKLILIFTFIFFIFSYSINSYSFDLFNSLGYSSIYNRDISLLGSEIKELYKVLPRNTRIFVKLLDRYILYNFYNLPLIDFSQYNILINYVDQNLTDYYNYFQLLNYLGFVEKGLNNIGYKIISLGRSVQGRILYAILPKKIDLEKKTVVMFFRQHGDEDAQNWIMEGLINAIIANQILGWPDNQQFIIYPMINPDGADMITRYNANGYDLNRVWNSPKDEIIIIRSHIDTLINQLNLKVSIVWDMHGSREDFIYRMPPSIVTPEYYDLQSNVIWTLGKYDPWHNGSFIHSGGDPGMARIVMAATYGLNALTHETVDYDSIRTVVEYRSQGVAMYKAMIELFY